MAVPIVIFGAGAMDPITVNALIDLAVPAQEGAADSVIINTVIIILLYYFQRCFYQVFITIRQLVSFHNKPPPLLTVYLLIFPADGLLNRNLTGCCSFRDPHKIVLFIFPCYSGSILQHYFLRCNIIFVDTQIDFILRYDIPCDFKCQL